MSALFQEVKIAPSLADMNILRKEPIGVADICGIRVFYHSEKQYDARTCILWYQGYFKCAEKFPWRNIKQNFLIDSSVGKVIGLIPQEYDAVHEKEFELINPRDAPSEIYALERKRKNGINPTSKADLLKQNAGRMNEPLTRIQASIHPVWLAVFNNNYPELSDFVDWVWDESSKSTARAMAMYIEDPKQSSAIAMQCAGRDRNFCLDCREGFEKEKVFLI